MQGSSAKIVVAVLLEVMNARGKREKLCFYCAGNWFPLTRSRAVLPFPEPCQLISSRVNADRCNAILHRQVFAFLLNVMDSYVALMLPAPTSRKPREACSRCAGNSFPLSRTHDALVFLERKVSPSFWVNADAQRSAALLSLLVWGSRTRMQLCCLPAPPHGSLGRRRFGRAGNSFSPTRMHGALVESVSNSFPVTRTLADVQGASANRRLFSSLGSWTHGSYCHFWPHHVGATQRDAAIAQIFRFLPRERMAHWRF